MPEIAIEKIQWENADANEGPEFER